MAAAAGADAIGVILHANSKRLIEAEYAMAVAEAVPPLVTKVGVFQNAKAPFVANCARSLKLDLVQLHGEETVDFIRAVPTLKIDRRSGGESQTATPSRCLPSRITQPSFGITFHAPNPAVAA